jgi:hypothetical protein
VAAAAVGFVALGLLASPSAAQSPGVGEAPPPPPVLAPDPSSVSPAPEASAAPPPPPPPRRREAAEPSSASSSAASTVAQGAESRSSAGSAPGAFVHEGFYLRVGLGGGYGKTSVQTDRQSQPDVTLDGLGAAFDVWFGWTLAPGLVLGPALSVSSQRSASASVGARESSAVATHALLGGFVDAYPNPKAGQHFGGTLALASLTETTADGEAGTDYQGAGFGLDVFAGYDAWLAAEWSLGAMLRLGGVATRVTQSIGGQSVEKQGTAYGASLLVTIVYH